MAQESQVLGQARLPMVSPPRAALNRLTPRFIRAIEPTRSYSRRGCLESIRLSARITQVVTHGLNS